LVDAAGAEVASGLGESGVVSICVLSEGCYTFTIYDAYGDGICCEYGEGSYSVSLDGEVVVSGGEFGVDESTTFGFGDCGDGGGSDCEVDEDEDGICDDVDDCVGAYDDCGVCNGDGSDCGGGDCDFGLTPVSVGGGAWDSEISWNITDSNGDVVAEGGAPEDQEVCLDPASCYTVNMQDAYGDGWNGAVMTVGDELTFTLEEGSEGSEQFGDCGGGGGEEVLGCTYSDASNYNALATSDDGSCIFDYCDPNAGYDAGFEAGVDSVENTCPSDLNGDGSITTGDLLVFLGSFGTLCE
jgi:hypothetical protein